MKVKLSTIDGGIYVFNGVCSIIQEIEYVLNLQTRYIKISFNDDIKSGEIKFCNEKVVKLEALLDEN